MTEGPEDGDRPSRRRLEISTPPMAFTQKDTLRAMAAARVAVERHTLTVINGPDAGRIFVLSSRAHILGRGELADLNVSDSDVSRQHARLLRTANGRTSVQDLGSTNGTFVNGERVTRAELLPGARVQCGPNLLLRYSLTDDVEEELHRRMYDSARRDVLTMAFNRRYLLDRLTAEVAHARRHHLDLALVMLDLDGFQDVNDVHGHAAGDVVLRAVATRLSRTIRVEDVFARWGGDEFAVLARSTRGDEARTLAERLRAAVSEVAVPVDDGSISLSACLGVGSLCELGSDAGAAGLIAMADRRLERAKSSGRNVVRAED